MWEPLLRELVDAILWGRLEAATAMRASPIQRRQRMDNPLRRFLAAHLAVFAAAIHSEAARSAVAISGRQTAAPGQTEGRCL